MAWSRRLITFVGASLLVASMSTSSFAVSKRTTATAQSDVRQLLRMMDSDKNGSVSKDEFLQYMSQTFNRLDVNRSRGLERNELSAPLFPVRKRTAAKAQSDARQLLRMMDRDQNASVSKDEFLQFMSQTFVSIRPGPQAD